MIQQQFVLKEKGDRVFVFIDDLCKRLNEASKKEAIENIQKIIITEYDARHMYYHQVNKALESALSVVKKKLKDRNAKEYFLMQYKIHKGPSLCNLINTNELESSIPETYSVKGNNVYFRVWKLSKGYFFHTMAGSELANEVISNMRIYWNISDTAHNDIYVISNGPEMHYKPVFYIDLKDIMTIDKSLMNKEKRAENLLFDYNIWSKEYHTAIENGPKNTIYEENIFGRIAKQIPCLSNAEALNSMKKSVINKITDKSWNEILNEAAADEQPVEKDRVQRKTNILKTISILSGGLRK